jgi:triphosphatase
MLSEEVVSVPAEAGGSLPIRPEPEPVREVELKLLASSDALSQLHEAPQIQRYARTADTARHLEAVYYDTPDRVLFRQGLTLRVRRNGRCYVQTLKRGPTPDNPFAREEWETPVDSVVPNLSLLPTSNISPLFAELEHGALNPIFVTKVQRRTRCLDLGGTQVEVAFDEGAIEVGDRSVPLAEVELEMKSGDSRALYDLGIDLIETTPLRVSMRSKAERGYDLAFGSAPQAVKAAAPILAPSCTVDDIVAALLGSCQFQVLANQAVAEAGHDPEGVHQMRVALRRLRTASTLLSRELGSPTLRSVSDDAKWAAQLLGAARDWDVFITETLTEPSQALGTGIDFDVLRRASEPHRLMAYETLREALASKRYNRFQLSLLRWIAARGWRNELTDRPLSALLEPGRAFASRVLDRLHHQAIRRGKHFQHLPPEGRHKVRIALKKLRYALEFFAELFGSDDEWKHYTRLLAKLQDTLGRENDAAVTLPRLVTVTRNAAAPELERCVGAVIGWQARDRIETGRNLNRHWSQFKSMQSVWAK